jgi:hypothetical protein
MVEKIVFFSILFYYRVARYYILSQGSGVSGHYDQTLTKHVHVAGTVGYSCPCRMRCDTQVSANFVLFCVLNQADCHLYLVARICLNMMSQYLS